MSTLGELLDIFDVGPDGEGRFIGGSDPGQRDVIDGSQLLAQAIVAAAKTVPNRSVRSAHATFIRPVRADAPIELTIDVVHTGRSFASLIVIARQGERICATIPVLLDTPQPDVVRHPVVPPSTGPDDAMPYDMPLDGRELRLVDCADPNDPDEVGPPALDAWLRYEQVPARDDLAKALIAHFTGHLSISATMRGHAGLGTAQAHHTVSTAVMTIQVVFHEPVRWDGWLRYGHDSTFVGSGMSYVRGEVRTESGELLASFTQEGMIRAFTADRADTSTPARARL